MRSSMGNDQACRVCCSLSQGAGRRRVWKNVLENAFPMIQPHFPTIFLIFQCFSETLSDRQMEAVASLFSNFKIHLILGDMFVSERFVREKSVHQATTQRPPRHMPAPNFSRLLSGSPLSEYRNGFADDSSALQWARLSCDHPWEMIRRAGSAAA